MCSNSKSMAQWPTYILMIIYHSPVDHHVAGCMSTNALVTDIVGSGGYGNKMFLQMI